MNPSAFEIAQAILLSIGGGAVIVFTLSSYLAKIWAQRILQNEKTKHDKDIAQFKNQLEELARVHSVNYLQKIDLYKLVSNPIVELVSLISKDGLTADHYFEFDRQRLHITAQLALFAPQSVFESFNEMIDYIYNSLDDTSYEFPIFREKILNLLSEMRKDIGIYKDSVIYRGNR